MLNWLVAISGFCYGDAPSAPYSSISGNAILTEITLSPVPEPGTALLIGIGLTGLALNRRQRFARS